jgi:hypothetical protein
MPFETFHRTKRQSFRPVPKKCVVIQPVRVDRAVGLVCMATFARHGEVGTYPYDS